MNASEVKEHLYWKSAIHATHARTVKTKIHHHQIFCPLTFEPSRRKNMRNESLTSQSAEQKRTFKSTPVRSIAVALLMKLTSNDFLPPMTARYSYRTGTFICHIIFVTSFIIHAAIMIKSSEQRRWKAFKRTKRRNRRKQRDIPVPPHKLPWRK